MCMGFGCNAAGIIGCRIIDSPRERLIAMITNNFVPCNGRFPTMIAIITMFFVGSAAGAFSSVLSAAILAGVIVLGVLMTLLISKILSATVLKGVPSSFTLELPPYRKPQIGKVIVRSIFDRTLFVLGRAIVVAAPAGLIIWLMANISVGDATLLAHCSGFLDPFAQVIGMDGVILLAFILGFPANEIVVPIIIMAYMAEGSLLDISDLSVLRDLLVSHGWTWITAASTMLCTAEVVPPTIKNAWAAPNASAARRSASAITDTGWHRLSRGFMELTSICIHVSPSRAVSSGFPLPLLWPGTSKGTTLIF